MNRLVLSIVYGLFMTGCSLLDGPKVAATVITPAKSSEAARIKEIAVLPFEGAQGKELSTDIESTLSNIKLADISYFKVADRKTLETVLKEIKFSQSGLVNREQTLRLGKLLGIKGIYTGSVNQIGIGTPVYYQETRSSCAEEDPNKNAWSMKRCKRYVDNKVSCNKTEAIYSFTPKLIEVETGKIIYSSPIKGTASTSSCSDQTTAGLSNTQLAEEAKKKALNQFRLEVAPSTSMIDIEMMDDSSSIENATAKQKFSQGIDFAKASRLDRACGYWNEANNISQTSAKPSISLIYNLGVCAEVSGDLKKAGDLYSKADNLLEKPNKKISEALNRIEKSKQDLNKVKQQVN